MDWRERWSRIQRVAVWLAWGGVVISLALFVLKWPMPAAMVIALAVFVFVVLGGSVVFLAWFYRRWLASWPGVLLAWAVVAAIYAWPSPRVNPASGFYTFVLMTAVLLLWATLALMLLQRDAGLALVIGLATAFAWSSAIASARAGGPANLLLLILSPENTSRAWWFYTLSAGVICIVPLAPFAIVGWLLFRLYREFSSRGSI